MSSKNTRRNRKPHKRIPQRKKSKKNIKKINTAWRIPNKVKAKTNKYDQQLYDKLWNNYLIEMSKPKKFELMANMSELLKKVKRAKQRGEYGMAVLYSTLAASLILAYNPKAPENVMDVGKLGHSLGPGANPDVLVKWGNNRAYPKDFKPISLTRREKRRQKHTLKQAAKK